MQDQRRRRIQPEGFQCGESSEKDDGLTFVSEFSASASGSLPLFYSYLEPHNIISCLVSTRRRWTILAVFHCSLPPPYNTILEFRCRDSSCGALEAGEEAATLADEDYSVDPNFFDEGYSMAGSTGFKVR